MVTQIQKWGNSLALRIPKIYADEVNIGQNSSVEFSIVDGSLVVRPIQNREKELEALLATITPDQLHGEIGFGPAVGREVFWDD